MGRALTTDLSNSLCAELLPCGSASQILARFNIRFHPLTTVANSPLEKTSYRVATLLTLEFTLPLRLEDSAPLRCKTAGYCVADGYYQAWASKNSGARET